MPVVVSGKRPGDHSPARSTRRSIRSAGALNKLDPTDTPATEPLFWPVAAPAQVAEGASFEEDVYVTPCPKPAAAGAALITLLMGIAAWRQRMITRSALSE